MNRPSVFERLSKTETVASLHQKFFHNEQHERQIKRSTSAPPSLRTKISRRGRSRRNNNTKKSNINHSKAKKGQVIPSAAAGPNIQMSSSFELFERRAEKHTAFSKVGGRGGLTPKALAIVRKRKRRPKTPSRISTVNEVARSDGDHPIYT